MDGTKWPFCRREIISVIATGNGYEELLSDIKLSRTHLEQTVLTTTFQVVVIGPLTKQNQYLVNALEQRSPVAV